MNNISKREVLTKLEEGSTRPIQISEHNIGLFKTREYQRNINKSRVNYFYNLVKQGGQLPTVFTINETQDEFGIKVKWLIDGQHRVQGIRKMIAENPYFKMWIVEHKHKNLSLEEEKKLYFALNNNAAHKKIDFIKQNWDDFPFMHLHTKEYPIDWTHTNANLILKAYLYGEQRTYSGISNRDFINRIFDLKDKDYIKLRLILDYFVDYFGTYDKNNLYWRPIFLVTLFIFINKNLQAVNNQLGEIFKRIRPIMQKKQIAMLTALSHENYNELYRQFKLTGNKSRSKKLFE